MMASQSEQRPTTTQRPLAVWIALAILLVYIPLLFLGVVVPSESVLDERDLTDLIIDFAELAVVLLSLTIAFWALATGRQWGRLFVAGAFTYIIGLLAWDQLFDPTMLEQTADDQTDLLLGACIGLSPLVVVILLVSLGSGVKTYFAPPPAPGEPSTRTES